MSRKSDLRKDWQSTKFEGRPQIFVKLSFRELGHSKLSGLHPFDMAIIYWVKISWKQKGRLWVHETAILGVIFLIFNENVCRNKWHLRDLRNIQTTGNNCRNALPCSNMALKLPQYFYLLMEKPVGCSFQVRSTYYQVTQCNQKKPVPVSSSWHVRSKKAK